MQTFGPISSNKLYIQIYNQVRDAIINGSYKLGDKLPSEKELAAMFNVSRVPVREALCALELNGLVESTQGVGVYVKQTNVITNDWIDHVELQDIIKARRLIEPEVAREAALNISELEKKKLSEIIEQFRTETEAGIYANETDRAFHMCIAHISGNSLYAVIYDSIFKAMEQKMWDLILRRTIASEKYRQKNFEEHVKIAETIMRGDAAASYETMKQHMENLEKRYWD